ncbi:hypothetical protein GSH19_04260 [Lactobacillus sp. S2-2]|uniref:RNA-directed DNA polymerase n=1 Tax=Lactobacillus sp. S2-2 TaxID=2692917 RepID=UPI001F1DC23F|nr:RNA-directed DNA polymerase [Lactobacillus sp. S2-2]MCF6515367.1 hypothetical protein [Lactobacillus sp. S2-2]
MISAMLYDIDDATDDMKEDQAIGFIGYNDTNKFFDESKLQRFNMEMTYPYVLQIDLSKFFENLYTHLLSQINDNNLFSNEINNDFNYFLDWLDVYNQKINDNHTKGIIQGPISSKITAELLQISLDQLINESIKKNKLDIRFTRYVDDYRFYSRRSYDLTSIKNKLTKLFRQYELSINESKIKIYKGFEQQKIAHLKNNNSIKNITEVKNHKYNLDDYIRFRDNFIDILNDKDIPTIKALLSILRKNINNKDIIFTDKDIISSLIMFLIKISYVVTILTSQVYKLIYSIIEKIDEEQTKNQIWEILFNEFNYIEESFPETDLEAWYFFVLSNTGNSDKNNIVFQKYKKNTDISDLNVIVLTLLLKKGDNKTNNDIQELILDIINIKKNISSIPQTKWWLPISKLWIVNNKDIDKKLKNLFIHNNKNLNWESLGLIEFLWRNK